MNGTIVEMTDKIFLAVAFMAMGGTAAIVFFFVFAQTIIGSKRIHRQLDQLETCVERMTAVLEKIEENLRSGRHR